MFKGVTVKSKEEVKTCRVGCGLMHDKDASKWLSFMRNYCPDVIV